MKEAPKVVELTTKYEDDLRAESVPYAEYPRPQFRRESYLNLNGEWDLVVRSKSGEVKYDGKILVPFAPESRLSGVEIYVDEDDGLIYERKFVLPEGFCRHSVVLHVGACDQFCAVSVNGAHVGVNAGGYLPFSFDITSLIVPGENVLKIAVTDPLDKNFAYGKQSKVSKGMWYTKISGIWQTVWLESLPEHPITALSVTTDLKGVNLKVSGGGGKKIVRLMGKEYEFEGSELRIDVEEPRLWSPSDPYLYEFEVASGEDVVKSYFGLRTIEVGTNTGGVPTLLVNGEPTYFHGLLDQGYYPDGIFLPATPKGFEDDVLMMKECGFNMLRKHIKLEPELFYYYCDKHGMFVFQDMINNGRYSFFRDTVLPTIGIKRGIVRPAPVAQRKEFLRQSEGIVRQLKNHPSVVYWTIFNEGWGQFAPKACYNRLKTIDPTRVWDTTSGWFKTGSTDVTSDHVYFKRVRVRRKIKKPWVLSEFGGYSCKVDGHVFREDKAYGYRTFADCDALSKGLERLYDEEIIPAIKGGLCASVLTQVSDVEEEINGLVTYDRRVLKVDADAMKKMAQRLHDAFVEFNRLPR